MEWNQMEAYTFNVNDELSWEWMIHLLPIFNNLYGYFNNN